MCQINTSIMAWNKNENVYSYTFYKLSTKHMQNIDIGQDKFYIVYKIHNKLDNW